VEWQDVMMEEYKALRTVVIESLKNQQSVLSLGITTISVIIGFGANQWTQDFVPDLMFLVFTPLFSYLILLIWIAEVSRVMLAGNSILKIETEINLFFDKTALNWETTLRSENKQTKINYYAVIFLFLSVPIASIFLGIWHYNMVSRTHLIPISVICIAESILFVAYLIYLKRKGAKLNKM